MVDHVVSLGNVDSALRSFELGVEVLALLKQAEPVLLRLVQLLFERKQLSIHFGKVAIELLSLFLNPIYFLLLVGNLLIE